MFKGLFDFFTPNIGIDLGTANSLVFVPGKGIVLHEPSIVAIDVKRGKVLKVGAEAKEMLGKTPENIQAIRPLRDGVITDFEITQLMISAFIKKTIGKGILKPRPRVVIGVPSGVTPVERRAVIEAAKSAGAREVYLVAEPMAAAIGSDLPISEPVGSMIIDIGGGTTEMAVISLGGIVKSESIRIAGDEMNEAIGSYVKKKYNLLIGEQTAERIKIDLGWAIEPEKEEVIEVKGRDITGLPRTVQISSFDVFEALNPTINEIITATKLTLEKTPPELASDIVARGMVLAGGGSLLRRLDKRISLDTGIKTYYCEEPLMAVARGVGKIVSNPDNFKHMLME